MSDTPKISLKDWEALKTAAKECQIPSHVFCRVITLVTGIPIKEFRGSMLDYDQFGEILMLLEKETLKLSKENKNG